MRQVSRPAKREGVPSPASPNGVSPRGGKHGSLVVAGQLEESSLWKRIADEEMPPDEPLTEDEKKSSKRWIEAGAPGLPKVVAGTPEAADHWAFAPPRSPAPSALRRGFDRPESDRPTLLPDLEGSRKLGLKRIVRPWPVA